jgi:hypothetical protein
MSKEKLPGEGSLVGSRTKVQESQPSFAEGVNGPQQVEQPIHGTPDAFSAPPVMPSIAEAESQDNRTQTFVIPENPLEERYRSIRFAHVLRELIYWHEGMIKSFETDLKNWQNADLRWYDDNLNAGVQWAELNDEQSDLSEEIPH